MNAAAGQVVAKVDDQVVAYALVMLRSFRERIPVLRPLFEQLDLLGLRSAWGDQRDFFVMGQICVGRPHRGSGVFGELYATMRAHYAERYRMVVTEISGRNTRSLRAHEKVGFEVLREYATEHGGEWTIVGWDWR